MYTNGENDWVGDNKLRTIFGERVRFNYHKNVKSHYHRKDYVESNNTRPKQPILMEETWSTRLLENRIFEFLLDLLEVKYNLGENHFSGLDYIRTMMEFRRIISRYIRNNPYLRKYDIKLEE